MNRHCLAALLCPVVVIGAAWIGASGPQAGPKAWVEVDPGVLRSPGLPAGYALGGKWRKKPGVRSVFLLGGCGRQV
jgi:hypothetical protein